MLVWFGLFDKLIILVMQLAMFSSVFYILLISLSFGYPADKIPLYFSFITSQTGNFISSGAIPIIDKALEQINNRSDILENYTLQYTTILDSNCNRQHSLDAFFYHFANDSQPTYISLLCCGCSIATIPVAEISHHWHMPQMAYASSASVLNDREIYRDFHNTLPSFDLSAATMAELMREFGWRQMAIITQEEIVFTEVTDQIEMIFDKEGFYLDSSVTLKSGLEEFPYEEVFSAIRNGNHRIINVNTYSDYLYKILCEAYYRGLVYPEYVWFILGDPNPQWWTEIPETNSSCPHLLVAKVVNGSFGFVPHGFLLDEDNNENTFFGKNATRFTETYQDLLQQPQYQKYNEHKFGSVGVAYDAMWSIALGLDITSRKIADGNDSGCEHLYGELVPLEMFDYANVKLGCIMRKSYDEVTFTGVTGLVVFDDGQRPDSLFFLRQYRELYEGYIERTIVADICHNGSNSTFEYRKGESQYTLWEDGVPYDGFAVYTIHSNNISLQVIYYIMASFGIVFAGACLVFNIVFRNRKVVKLASPNLNFLIIVGSVLLYTCVYLYVYSPDSFSEETFMCNFRIWVFSLGYTICFAVILSKTWRIYYIFNNPTAKKKTIKDWILVVVIAIVVIIDLSILFIGTAIPESRLEAVNIFDAEHVITVSSDGIRHENHIYICTRQQSVIWLGISFAYKGALQVIAIFMAFHTRKVKIKALNDSKEIAAIIYINSIMLAILAVTEFALQDYHDVYAALFGIALLIEATLFLGLIFVPKMVSLYFDPNGEKLFVTSKSTSNPKPPFQSQPIPGDSMSTNIGLENVASLKARIQELESELALKKLITITTGNKQSDEVNIV